MDNNLYHYGMPRRSGRYPWGSGQDPYQNAIGWRGHVTDRRSGGLTDKEIAIGEGISLAQLRARDALARAEFRAGQRSEVIRLYEKGMSKTAIGVRMGINESQVRGLLNPVLAERASVTKVTMDILKDEVLKNRYIDVGPGVANVMGVPNQRLNNAVLALQEQGYKLHTVRVRQAALPDQQTTMKVLGAPDTEWRPLVDNPSLIKNITMISNDYGRTFNSDLGLKPVQSISSDRIKVQYGEEGKSKDGVIELRRGAKDLDMGGSKYAQVRIGVDGTHFLKGMAIYRDDMPKDVDVIFNTNKRDTGNKLDAFKEMKITKEGIVDPDNPFGATIKEGGQRGALNILNEEGDWYKWSKTISSQVLSKQPVPLAKNQLDLALSHKQEEYDEISSLTNPIVKKQLLLAFAEDADSASVHLKAAGLPRQASKVILPVPGLKPTEVYAPTFNDGEVVVLIRHPHGGTFEIPQLTVNNKSKEAESIMKNALDAVGIHPSVAQKLSGADFDGDTVIVIPNPKGLIKTSASLKGLENFDPIETYPPFDGMKTIDGGKWNAKTGKVEYPKRVKIIDGEEVITDKKHKTRKQVEMGIISNLITDMTIKGATPDKIARAVRHSMVVIDSEKHALNYRKSYEDNGIASLHAEFQNSKKGGASTIVSRAKSKEYISKREKGAFIGPVSERTGRPTKLYIDPNTGENIYTIKPDLYTNKQGKIVEKTEAVSQMLLKKDAGVLSSGRQIELVYAGYANDLKRLANRARKDSLSIIPTPYSPSAAKVYLNEVKSLMNKLDIAKRNAPLEREAQRIAKSIVDRKMQDNFDMEDDDIKKIRNQAIAEARSRTGANKIRVSPTDAEWEAIQAGAISPSKLEEILRNANLDRIKELATPRTKVSMTSARIGRARGMLAGGATLAEVSDALGVSVSTLIKALE